MILPARALWRPPISVLAVIAIRAAQLMYQIERHGLALIATPLGAFGTALFVGVEFGLWRMRKWALIWVLGAQAVTAAHWSLTPSLWRDRYPLLGPTVPWILWAIFAACLLPHWKRMSWRL